MIGFLFATHTEAKILMERCAAKSLQQEPFAVYQLTNQHNPNWGHLLVSGVGKVRSPLVPMNGTPDLMSKVAVRNFS